MSLRIGAVGYVNTLPLIEGITEILPEADVLRGSPSLISRELAEGKLDLGLVPVVHLAGQPDLPVVPGLGIASFGPVRSVLLHSRRPLSEIDRLVADPASRTSNLLSRLWLCHELGREIPMVPGEDDPRLRLEAGPATVVIGDEALFRSLSCPVTVDLGEAWTAWTGLPFVYAVWAGPGAERPEVVRGLTACLQRNEMRLEEIAVAAGGGDSGRIALIESYLRENIRFRLGEPERIGLDRFLQFGEEAGDLPPSKRGSPRPVSAPQMRKS